MLAKALKADTSHTRKKLLLLLLASFACVALIAAGLAEDIDTGALPAGLVSRLPALGFAAFGLLSVILIWHGSRTTRLGIGPFETETGETRDKLAVAGALVTAEPQILILWEKDQRLKTIVHTLSSVPGVPAGLTEVLRFEQWLEPASAKSFSAGLAALSADGKPFSAILRTNAGSHLESDGSVAGGRAVLRLRDIAGHKRDLLEIVARHQRLVRDIRASRALLEILPLPVWMKDAAGRINWVNGAYVTAVEASSEAEVFERQIELLDTRQRQSVDRALAAGQTYRKRTQVSIGGERRAHDIVVLPLDGTSAAAAVDVSAVEMARKDPDGQAQVYDRTLDRMATAVAIFNREQKLTFYNAAYLKLWQLDAPWLERGPTSGAVLDRLRDLGRLPEVVNYREWKAKTLSSYKAGAEHDDWWHLPDGRSLHVTAELRPDGGITLLYLDETERLAHESRFNELITAQRETLDSLKEGVAVFTTDGRLKLHNTAFTAIWKIAPSAVTESPHIDEIIRHCRSQSNEPQVWGEIGGAVTAFSEQRGGLRGQMARSDGAVIDYAATPLPDGAMLLTFADITAAKQYESALLERNEALVVADRLKDQFVGHVSYALRTPLENIIGFGDLLASPRAGALTSKQREYLNDIRSSSKTLLALIDDLLDAATIDAGALELKLGRVEVRGVVESAIQGVRDRAARARLTLDIGIADDAVAFDGDEGRVRQVLYNLLSNAIGFSSTGKVVRLSCWRENGHMVFAVEDEGIGIPKEQQSIVFERFESRTHGLRHRGAGLGLSIVKSLVDLHGGLMELNSEPGQGTRVTVRFPERADVQPTSTASGPRAKAARVRPSKTVAA